LWSANWWGQTLMCSLWRLGWREVGVRFAFRRVLSEVLWWLDFLLRIHFMRWLQAICSVMYEARCVVWRCLSMIGLRISVKNGFLQLARVNVYLSCLLRGPFGAFML
jgi:hypothetical protein